MVYPGETAPRGRPELAPVRDGQELPWGNLAAYLRDHLDGVDGPMGVLQFPNGNANLTYLVSFGDTPYVIRRPPFGLLALGAHDMRREHRALSKMWRVFRPAPRGLLFCDDHSVIGSDFLVIEYREGAVIWDRIPESMSRHSAVSRRIGLAVADALAELHGIDPGNASLSDLGQPDGFVARQLAGWLKRWELLASDDANPIMLEVSRRLVASVPVPQRASVLHNDFKLDNCQFNPDDPDQVYSIFDWDMASLGDPLIDLGTLLNYWPDPADEPTSGPMINPGMESIGPPARAEMIDRYCSRSRLDPSEVHWYEAFACWKTAVVLRQLYVRYERGESSDPRMAAKGALVLPQAQRAASLLGLGGF